MYIYTLQNILIKDPVSWAHLNMQNRLRQNKTQNSKHNPQTRRTAQECSSPPHPPREVHQQRRLS